jgi:prolyl 4-hydroxylase
VINGGADLKGGGADPPTVQDRFKATLGGGAGSLSEAVARVEADARDGLPAASHLLATLAAAGIGTPQSWPRAISHLVDAARGGSTLARGQLEVLGSDRGAAEDDPWTALAASTRVADWMAPCEKRVLNASPRTVAIDGFLPRRACDWLIGLARGRVKPALVYNPDGSRAVQSGARSNSFVEFGILNCDVVALLIRQRIAATIGAPVGALENSQVLHYDVGEQFAPHFDYLDPALPEVAERGQRIMTFLIYLNDGFDGGETDFPRLGLRHKGAAGDALHFGNLDPAGGPDPRTLHAGLPPTHGEKWLFSQWVRNRARV